MHPFGRGILEKVAVKCRVMRIFYIHHIVYFKYVTSKMQMDLTFVCCIWHIKFSRMAKQLLLWNLKQLSKKEEKLQYFIPGMVKASNVLDSFSLTEPQIVQYLQSHREEELAPAASAVVENYCTMCRCECTLTTRGEKPREEICWEKFICVRKSCLCSFWCRDVEL